MWQKIVAITLVHCCLLSAQPSEQARRDLAQVTGIAVQTRRSTGDPVPSPEEEERLAKAIEAMLEDYTAVDGLRGGIYRMLINGLIHDPDELEVEAFRRSEDFFGGGSGSPVYFVHDRQGKLVSVVKAFPILGHEMKGFIEQLSASDLLSQLGLRESTYAESVMLGSARRGDRRYALIALEPAEGRELRSLVADVGQAEESSFERQIAFAQLVRAMTKVGRALAELHVAGGSLEATPGHGYTNLENHVLRKMEEAIRDGEPEVKRVDLDRLQLLFQSLGESAWSDRGLIGFVHGDAHPGNFFYDPATDRLTMIDIDGLHKSVGALLEPKAPVGFDYYRFLAFTQILTHYHGFLPEEEAFLLETIESAYWNTPGMVKPSERTRQYWELFTWAVRCAGWGAPAPGKSPAVQDQLAELLPYVIDQFLERVETYWKSEFCNE
jgi:Phosphotransferase enzyme family